MYQLTGRKSKNKHQTQPACTRSDNDLLKDDAGKLLKAGQYAAAEEKYKKLVMLSPRFIPIVLQEYEKLLINDLSNVNLKMSLSDVSFFLDDLKEARYELEEIIELDPSNTPAYLKLARILQKHDPLSVVALYEQAYRYLPHEEEIVDELVSSYVQIKDYPKAIAIYQKLLEKHVQSPKVIKILAELYSKNKQYMEAAQTNLLLLKNSKGCLQEVVAHLEELLVLVPDDIFIMESLADSYVLEMKPELSLKLLERICQIDEARIDETIKKIKKILSQYPDFVPALVTMGYMYIKVHLYSEAVLCFTKLMKDNSRYIDEAVMGYQSVLDVCPEQVLARQYLGEAYLITRRFDEAIREFDRLIDYNSQDAGLVMTKCRCVLKENDTSPVARLLLAKCYFVREEYKKAYSECCAIPAGIPRKVLVDSFMLRIRATFALERFDESRKYFYQLLEVNEPSRYVHEFCAEYGEKLMTLRLERERNLEATDPGLYHYLVGQRAFIQNDLEEAIKAFQVSARESRLAGISFYLLGLCFKSRGRFDLAINQMNRAYEVACDANNYATMNKIRYHIGLAFESLGDLRSAIEQYEKILEIDITFTSVKDRIAEINQLSWSNMAGKALIGLDRGLEQSEMIVVWVPNREARVAHKKEKRAGMVMDVSFSQSHNDEGVNHFLKGRIKAAEEEFHLAVQLDVNFTVVYNNLGLLHLEKHNFEEAKKNFERALEDNPNLAVVHANLGLLCYKSGEMAAAKEHYLKAISMDPKLSNVLLNLGDICYKQGEIERALNYWEQACKESTLPELALRRLLFKRANYVLEEEMSIL